MLDQPADTPSRRLLVDETVKVLDGLACVLDEVALLAGVQGGTPVAYPDIRAGVADWLPAVVNGVRAFVTIGAVELFWVATAWPDGGSAIVFVTIILLLMSPRGDLAYLGAVAFTVTATGAIVAAAIMEFAVLPDIETFPALCAAIGLFLVPVGFAAARSGSPALTAMLGGLGVAFVRLLTPNNPMIYDTAQFYNLALAIFVGCAIGAVAFRLMPPLSPALRSRRLLALTLRDLRRLAIGILPRRQADWERRLYDRLAALPDGAEPLQRARLLAALSVGGDINRLHRLIPGLGMTAELDAALVPPGRRRTARRSISRLYQLDSRLVSAADTGPEVLRVRGRIAALSEVLAEHGSYFDSMAPA